MRTGKLRHRVEVQRYATSYDPEGEPIQEWQLLAKAWAAIEPLKGEEYLAAMSTQARVSHKVTMRPLAATISPADRIIYNGRILEIESVLNLEERDRELVLMCVEKA